MKIITKFLNMFLHDIHRNSASYLIQQDLLSLLFTVFHQRKHQHFLSSCYWPCTLQ